MLVAYLERVQASQIRVLHFSDNRRRSLSRQAVDTGADQKMRVQFLRQAEQLIDVTLPVSDVNTPPRVAQQLCGLAQVL